MHTCPPRIPPKQKEEQMENSSPNPSFSICDIQIQKQMSRSFGKSFPQKIVLPKLHPHCFATYPRPWGQNTKEKFHHRHIREARNIFLWCCRVKRGSGGTIHSFIFRSNKFHLVGSRGLEPLTSTMHPRKKLWTHRESNPGLVNANDVSYH